MQSARTPLSRRQEARILAAAAASGAATALGQVVFLREVLALFCGFELAAGVFLAAWLLWTALGSRLAAKAAPALHPGALLLLLALLLPGTLLLLRASRPLWNIPLGELPGLGLLLAVCTFAPALFCLCSGALFAVCWAQSPPGRPLRVYLAEALGSGLAGLALFFVLLPLFSTLQSVLAVFVLLFTTSGFLLRPPARLASRTSAGRLVPLLLLLPLVPILSTQLEHESRTWQWGTHFAAGLDTPYQSLAACKQAEQLSLFADGGWLFSIPDPLSTEFAVEPVLLLHPHPKSVLLLGGDPFALPAQVRKHPQVKTITMVEQDPGIPALLRQTLRRTLPRPFAQKLPKTDPLRADPGVLLRSPGPRYDVILLQLGEPTNAGRNRFYTRDFFQAAASKLAPGGLFSFTAPGAPEAVGPVQARLLRSLNATLRSVFPMVLALPGEQIRFVASPNTSHAGTDYANIQPGPLLQRMRQRAVPTRFFRQQNVRELFSPFKRGYLQSLFAAPPQPVLNEDFRPACYLDSLLAWARQMNETVFALLQGLAAAGTPVLWSLTAAACLLLAGAPLAKKNNRLPMAAATAVCVTGACEISLQLLVLLAFQILAGSLFSRLALLVAASMAGLALGAWLTPQHRPPLRPLLWTQAALCLLLAGCGPFFRLLHGLETPLPGGLLLGACLVPTLCGGLLGGLHFGLASRLLANTHAQPRSVGGKLYALDLAGAALGSFLVSLLLLPLYGLQPVLLAWALLCAASLCGLALAGKKTPPAA